MKKSRFALSWCVLLMGSFLLHAGEFETIHLWTNGAPGFEDRRNEPEQAQSYWVRNINNPSITVFLPPKEKANGAAVLIFPGGGHRELVFQAEGVEPARYLTNLGVAAFVLKYRLAREQGSPYSLQIHPRQDAQRALRLIRSRAAEWNLDANRIGVMGFSAGGEVASMLVYSPSAGDPAATDPIEREDSLANFQIVIYPGRWEFPNRSPPMLRRPFFSWPTTTLATLERSFHWSRNTTRRNARWKSISTSREATASIWVAAPSLSPSKIGPSGSPTGWRTTVF